MGTVSLALLGLGFLFLAVFASLEAGTKQSTKRSQERQIDMIRIKKKKNYRDNFVGL